MFAVESGRSHNMQLRSSLLQISFLSQAFYRAHDRLRYNLRLAFACLLRVLARQPLSVLRHRKVEHYAQQSPSSPNTRKDFAQKVNATFSGDIGESSGDSITDQVLGSYDHDDTSPCIVGHDFNGAIDVPRSDQFVSYVTVNIRFGLLSGGNDEAADSGELDSIARKDDREPMHLVRVLPAVSIHKQHSDPADDRDDQCRKL